MNTTPDLTSATLDASSYALERSIVAALPLVLPSAAFVSELAKSLSEEAARRQQAQQRLYQALLMAGVVSGGLLTVLGGIVGLSLWKRRRLSGGAGTSSVSVSSSATIATS